MITLIRDIQLVSMMGHDAFLCQTLMW